MLATCLSLCSDMTSCYSSRERWWRDDDWYDEEQGKLPWLYFYHWRLPVHSNFSLSFMHGTPVSRNSYSMTSYLCAAVATPPLFSTRISQYFKFFLLICVVSCRNHPVVATKFSSDNDGVKDVSAAVGYDKNHLAMTDIKPGSADDPIVRLFVANTTFGCQDGGYYQYYYNNQCQSFEDFFVDVRCNGELRTFTLLSYQNSGCTGSPIYKLYLTADGSCQSVSNEYYSVVCPSSTTCTTSAAAGQYDLSSLAGADVLGFPISQNNSSLYVMRLCGTVSDIICQTFAPNSSVCQFQPPRSGQVVALANSGTPSMPIDWSFIKGDPTLGVVGAIQNGYQCGLKRLPSELTIQLICNQTASMTAPIFIVDDSGVGPNVAVCVYLLSLQTPLSCPGRNRTGHVWCARQYVFDETAERNSFSYLMRHAISFILYFWRVCLVVLCADVKLLWMISSLWLASTGCPIRTRDQLTLLLMRSWNKI